MEGKLLRALGSRCVPNDGRPVHLCMGRHSTLFHVFIQVVTEFNDILLER